ncbi:MAG TPA: DUF1957 domain-containing protein [bacterium]|nr:DUF1957 domain-containing protein [bacterium]
MAHPRGYLCLVLHAHLPFVRHPEHPEFLEEDWLFEAMIETYLPLLAVYERLVNDNVNFRITMSLTPPLCEMLVDPLLQERAERRLESLLELAEKEVHRTSRGDMRKFHDAACMYERKLTLAMDLFQNRYHRNLVAGFRAFQDHGVLEIITCGATHGFMPLIKTENAKRAQIQIAKTNYEKHFGRLPRGIWLAECGYAPGVDRHLADQGVRFFFMDAHGLLYGKPYPRYGVFAPVYTPNRVAAFARDIQSSRQVWSREEGYPGDFDYREFYRDIGYDAPYDYIRPYLHSDGVRRNVGLKYHRITGAGIDLGKKEPYLPDIALERAATHAGNFMFNRQHQCRHLFGVFKRPPILVAPYDAELFGHWWYEGPDFIEFLCRKIHFDQSDIKMITPSEYLEKNKSLQVIEPTASSWGDKGYNEVWLNASNDWIYRHLHLAESRMIELAQRFPVSDGILRRALNQAARELLLAQSSDWAFIMTTGTVVSYAVRRTREHIHRFTRLYEQAMARTIEESLLNDYESKDSIFQEIDYTVYA